MKQLLLHLPDDLVDRLKRAVPLRGRSAFVQQLLEQALPSIDDDPLYHIGLAVEQDERLGAEMAQWNVTVGDGLGGPPRPPLVVAMPSAGPDSVAVCDQLRAVDKTRLVRREGKVSSADLRAVEQGVRAVLVL